MKLKSTGFLVVMALVLFSCGKSEASSAAGVVETPASVDSVLKKAAKFRLTLIELGSVRCRPCQMMTPVLESVATSYQGRVRVVFFDVWKDHAPARHFAIRVIPVQIFLDSAGREVFRHEGYYPEDRLKAKIDQLLK